MEFIASFFEGVDTVVKDILVGSISCDRAGERLAQVDEEVIEPCPAGFPRGGLDSWHRKGVLLGFGELALADRPKAHLVDDPNEDEEGQGGDELVEDYTHHRDAEIKHESPPFRCQAERSRSPFQKLPNNSSRSPPWMAVLSWRGFGI